MRASLSRITAAMTGQRAAAQGGHGLPGWFIAVEGGEGAGKSTQLEALAGWLRKRGFDVEVTREPGATALGEQIREIVLHAREYEVGARAEALLFAADRADHVEKVVRPALQRGAIVLTDRHVDSSIAYQSGGRGLAADDVAALSEFATEGLRPNLVILLDIDPSAAWERMQVRADGPDKVEAEPAEFHTRVRQAFKARAAADPERYLVVDAAEPAGVVTAIIQDRLEELLPPSMREAAEAREREEALRAAQAAEREEQEARAAAARAAAERQAELKRVAAEQAREEAEQAREQARQAQARRAAEQRAEFERRKAEEARVAELERRAAEVREAERRQQEQSDAEHRRQAELAVRQIEAKAKGLAREQAARDLDSRAESEARTARMVEAARQERSLPMTLPAASGEKESVKEPVKEAARESARDSVKDTAVLPLNFGSTQLVAAAPAGRRFPERGDDDWDDDDDDDVPRSRWRLGGIGKRKP
jgi:dTMP kinase